MLGAMSSGLHHGSPTLASIQVSIMSRPSSQEGRKLWQRLNLSGTQVLTISYVCRTDHAPNERNYMTTSELLILYIFQSLLPRTNLKINHRSISLSLFSINFVNLPRLLRVPRYSHPSRQRRMLARVCRTVWKRLKNFFSLRARLEWRGRLKNRREEPVFGRDRDGRKRKPIN